MSAAPATLPADAPAQRSSVSRHLGPILLFAALLLVPFAARFGTESYVLSLMTRVLVLALAAMSLDLLIGFGGLVSFGHAAFLGIGAYAVGILSAEGVHDGLVHLGVALAAAAVFATLTGLVAVRTQGVYFIMITLAFGQMLYFVATALAQYGGDDGMTLARRSQLFGRDVLAGDTALYYAAFLVLLLGYLALRRVVASRFGRVLTGSRENPTRMAAVGFRPFRYQLVAYILSGMMAAAAGCLLANQTGFVSPATMTWQRSGDLIFMAVLGGLGSLHGPILGAITFLVAEEWLAGLTEHWRILFGPLLILVVLFARGGLTGPFGRRA
jgi:branched-chain amino acid transport system permease protein